MKNRYDELMKLTKPQLVSMVIALQNQVKSATMTDIASDDGAHSIICAKMERMVCKPTSESYIDAKTGIYFNNADMVKLQQLYDGGKPRFGDKVAMIREIRGLHIIPLHTAAAIVDAMIAEGVIK